MMKERDFSRQESIRVAAPVIDADIPVCSEVLHAKLDPAHPDQAILVSVPVLVDSINFGDIVGLAPEDEHGVRRITEVVVPSGHVHMLVAVDDGEVRELVEELARMFPAYGLRVVAASATIVSISVHPHLDAREVEAVVAAWLGSGKEESAGELAIAPACQSEVGLLAWG
jgi:hypothetical protein